MEKQEAFVGEDGVRRRIELLSTIDFVEACGKPPGRGEGIGEPEMSDRVVGVELDGAFKFLLAGDKIPFAPHKSEGEGAVRFGERIVEFDGLAISGNGAVVGLIFRHESVLAEEKVGVGETDVRLSVGRIVDDGLSEIVESPV